MFKIKKWLYLLNDATNAMLDKDKEKNRKSISKLKTWIFVIIILLAISAIFNLYQYFIK
ncbi:MAG: hypothetical protein ABIG10_02205 [bacterium]